MSSVVVAGSGQRGLICAARLAAAGVDVVVVERLPHPGGQEPERTTARLAKAARQAGARLVLGTLAVQYDGAVVDILGVDGAGSLPCDALVVATGSRPATRAELGITGDRCAGVVPGSAALHLTQAGVLLGHRPLIAGSGAFAAHCAQVQLAAGASEVTMTLPASAPDEVRVPAGVRVFAGYRVASVHGTPRIEVAVLHLDSRPPGGAGEAYRPGEGRSPRAGAEPLRIAADALILAAGMRPMRNIEGAVTERDGVFFCQPEGEDRGESYSQDRCGGGVQPGAGDAGGRPVQRANCRHEIRGTKMRVLSPVGTFPVRLTGARVERGGPVIEAAMGAWRSEVRLEPADLPLLLGAGALLAAAFMAGRMTSGGSPAR